MSASSVSPAIVRGSPFDRTRTHKRRGQWRAEAISTQWVHSISTVLQMWLRVTVGECSGVRARTGDVGLQLIRSHVDPELMLSADT